MLPVQGLQAEEADLLEVGSEAQTVAVQLEDHKDWRETVAVGIGIVVLGAHLYQPKGDHMGHRAVVMVAGRTADG
jgi:hypothetical protein